MTQQWILKDTTKKTYLWSNGKYILLPQDYILQSPAQIKVADVQYPRSIFRLWTMKKLYNSTGFKQLDIIDISPIPEKYYEKSNTFTEVSSNYKVTRTYTYNVKDIANFLPNMLDMVKTIREEKIAQGVYWEDVTSTKWIVQTDVDSIQNLMRIVSSISAGIPLPESFVWRMKDNTLVPMDEISLKEMANVVLNHVNQCYKISWQHKTAIAGLSTIAAIQAYEKDTINTLWPEAPV